MNKQNNSHWNAGHKVGKAEVINKLKKLIRNLGRTNFIMVERIEELINEFEDKLKPNSKEVHGRGYGY